MKSLIPILFCLLVLFSTTGAFARIIGVPGDSPTIQAGIDASTPGDTVLVQPGHYLETIDFKGKDIVLGSLFITTQDTSSISRTIIDGNKNGTVVKFKTGETEEAELCGFTVTGGDVKWAEDGIRYESLGSGIRCNHASPRLHHLRITGNSAYMNGGGIHCEFSNSAIDHVVIDNNRSQGAGGIYIAKGNHKISCSIIKDNSLSGIVVTENSMVSCNSLLLLHNSQEALASGISSVDIINCTITGHDDDAFFISESNVNVINSVFWNDYREIYIYDGQQGFPISRVTVAFSDFKGGKDRIKFAYKDQLLFKEGNIDKYPDFNSDYTLNLMSPCIDAGTPFYQVNDSTIVDLNKNEYHGIAPDMGAFESGYTQTEDRKSVV